MPPVPPVVDIRGLSYAYRRAQGHRILEAIDLRLDPGEYWLLAGASGSGKSTLVRTFNGLIPHFYGGRMEGEVRVCGRSTRKQSVATLFARVGLVFQNAEAQLFNRSVERELAFGLESLGLDRRRMRRRIAETAARFQIEGLLERSPHTLSGGQQQLVAIAAVMVLAPDLVVLDEPYANLDPTNGRRVREALKRLAASGTGVAVCEHRLALAAADADRMGVLRDGRLVHQGPPVQVLSQSLDGLGLALPAAVQVGRRLRLSTPLLTMSAAIRALDNRLPLPERADTPPAERLPAGKPVVVMQDVALQRGGDIVLDGIDFTLHAGECLAVVGGNGAGKTTLLRLLLGLLRPSTGRIVVKDRETAGQSASQLARHVGLAFQNPNSQFFKLTVAAEIAVAAKALGCEDADWMDELTALFHLETLLDRAPFKLSSGEKKRVAFAAALSARPAVLAMDEPTAGQDHHFRQALGGLMAELCRRQHAVLLVTQDLDFAHRHAHQWLVLAAGRIVARGTPEAVMADTMAMQLAGLEPTDRFILGQRFGAQWGAP
jgi:energy-coupling factor transporter ATP-binding protein EcfA2